jgi:peptidyl-prolyl cis-trans isomerase A (cyclophilin A)
MKGGFIVKQLFIILFTGVLCFGPELLSSPQQKGRKPGLYAVFDTSMGTFVCELYEKSAPLAVENFVGLAQGTKEWLTPKGDMVKKPFYNGITFHRVIKGFMIQAGDISGKGNFQYVINFQDEIVPALRFDRPGVLAMANYGKNTNGTQFFVTVAPQPHLNGKHTIFGRVTQGLDVVQKISDVPVGPAKKPSKDVIINKITIERAGKPAR